jgi:hypothetical protein
LKLTKYKAKIIRKMGKIWNNKEGPLSYENWKSYLRGGHIKEIFEIPLFSDARVTGENVTDYKPYYFLNPVPLLDRPGLVQPTIYLRIESCLTFKMPDMSKTDTKLYHGGTLPDEVAALASLALGIRLKAGNITRFFDPNGDPRGHPVNWFPQPTPVVLIESRGLKLPFAVGEHSLCELSPLAILPTLSPSDAIALIKGARLYQDALWIAESEPSLSWIMFVSAIETAANHWRKSKDIPLERLKISKPDLVKYLDALCIKDLSERVADSIVDSLGNTKKFVDFIINFLPYPPQKRPPDWAQFSWQAKKIKEAMRLIYEYRSRALHDGLPFPAPMCISPGLRNASGIIYLEKPIGSAYSTLGGIWKEKDIPMVLHTFEYIVRRSLLKWWDSMKLD